MRYKFLLFIILCAVSLNSYSINCKVNYLDSIRKNILNCNDSLISSSSKEICDRYENHIRKCLTVKVDNAYFFNLFYSPGSSIPDKNIMNLIFNSDFKEIFESINKESTQARISIVGHSDPLPTRKSSYFDVNDVCYKANLKLKNNSNSCLSLNRAAYLFNAVSEYKMNFSEEIQRKVTIDLPCYSEDFFVRNINNALEGKVWKKLKIENKIEKILSKYKIDGKFFMLNRNSNFWKKIPSLPNLKTFRLNNKRNPVTTLELDNYTYDLSFFRTVVLIVWTGDNIDLNKLSPEKGKGLYCLGD